jgi:hypothetical protein
MRTAPSLAYFKLLIASDPGQLGWLLFGFSMMFVWTLGIRGDYRSVFQFAGTLDNAIGTVTKLEEGFGDENESEIWGFSYTFVGPDGNQYSGVSYSGWHRFAVGNQVDVEFPVGNPAVSRIVGMRRTEFDALVAVAFIFPALGLFLIGRGFARGRKAYRLLLSGKQAQGKLESEVPDRGSSLVNYDAVFSFMTASRRICSLRQKIHVLASLEDKSRTVIFYSPDNPADAVLAHAVPGLPYVDENDMIVFKEPIRLWAYLILPTICLVGHGVWAWVLFC